MNGHKASDLQTGPAMRHDREVMERQVDLLQHHPEWADVYKAVSASIEKMYTAK